MFRSPMFKIILSSAICLLLIAPAVAGRKKKAPKVPPEGYRDMAAELTGKALVSDVAYERLVELCDGIGHRLSGSPGMKKAIQWAYDTMASDGLTVRKEAVVVPKWTRGHESLTVLAPLAHEFDVLALGMSVGTPEDGLEGEVVVIDNFEQLDELGSAVKGKIVLYDVPFTTYGATVKYRTRGPSRAAAHGAIATLVRSVSPVSLSTPHTGTLRYDDAHPKIPAAAVSIEGATQIRRLTERGETVTVRLKLGAKLHGDVESANVIGEVKGGQRPEEIVVLACHLDSWDVGTGAQDDGAGCVAAMEAVRFISQASTPPKRTVRAVLYTNEENGIGGGRQYAIDHAADLKNHIAMIEMDTGSGQPLGFRVDARAGVTDEEKAANQTRILTALQPLIPLFEITGATDWFSGYSGADIGPSVEQGVLGFGVHQDTTNYWPIHHTKADTVDKVDKNLLNKNIAAMSVLAYILADWEDAPRVSE